MFFGVYQQLQEQQSNGTGHKSNAEAALLEWPASFSGAWQPYPQTPVVQWSLTLEAKDAETTLHTQEISYAKLATLPLTYQIRRLASAQGWAFKDEWQGITLNHLRELLPPSPDVHYLEVEDIQGLKAIFPWSNVTKHQAMLVLHQGSQALSPWHGGPIRFMAFDYVAEYNLGQVKTLRFLNKISKAEKALSDAQVLAAGKYYCYDLKEVKEHLKTGEPKGF
ncbi:MAG: molybdopterin-dependent oxidoreductase [Vampirovibrio sp.]